MSKKIHLMSLLDFYDYKVKESETHASAINSVIGEDLAVALMTHFFNAEGFIVNALDLPCTQGTQKGYRLDKWIALESNEIKTIFQVEIKNWSAHSFSGTVVKRDGDEDYMQSLRLKRWKFQFNEEKKVPSQKETLKVLTKMKVPQSHLRYEHKTLLCFWEPMHPLGKEESFFEVGVASLNFSRMSVFSMSNYVRKLLKTTETIEVNLRDSESRINWLNKIYF
jgi:hypothetical protein